MHYVPVKCFRVDLIQLGYDAANCCTLIGPMVHWKCSKLLIPPRIQLIPLLVQLG